MTDFRPFGKLVSQRFAQLASSHDELFSVELPDIFDVYLGAFPEGSNPIFRERTEHDCNCCKQFVRNIGRVVAIKDGKIATVWDVAGLESPYDIVAKELGDAVRSAAIQSVFRTKESSYSHEKNLDNHDASITWYHFHAKVPKKFVHDQPGTVKGKFTSIFQVLKRGLDQIRQSDLEAVLDLIKENALYRGREFEKSIQEFRALQKQYVKAGSTTAFAWENVHKGCAGFRNTVMGTLLVDLAEGDDIETAVKKFEAKVAPANYKRPTALITPRMIEAAVTKLRELDLEDAIYRRLAAVEDLSVNDVLFVDNSVASKMKDSLTDLLLSSPSVKKSQKAPKDPTEIRIEDFISLGSKSIELIVSNEHLGNFVTLTAPVHQDVKPLFKWENNFGWSYDGEVADAMRQRVSEAGGRVDGPFRFTHSWNHEGRRNASLMDLHVFFPGCSSPVQGCQDAPTGRGQGRNLRVGWDARNHHATGAAQDVDYTSAAPAGHVPIENIAFPDKSRMPEGTYECYIHNWTLRSPNTGGFKAQIEVDGTIFDYDYPKPVGRHEWVHVASVTLRDGRFTVEHRIPSSANSREKWGVHTLEPVKVQAITLSPNHWEGAGGVGNKHWFFVLENCRTTEPQRGLYNEFLRNELEPHRKVFETLSSRAKCQPTDKQLSGVGFSETKSAKVNAIADGRPYTIVF